jgi:thioredoxin reductase (NADPH)
MSDHTHQAIVIGSGFSGLSAAFELARRGVGTALVDDGYLGGLIANVGAIEAAQPYGGHSGADLASAMLGEALEAGADYHMGEAAALECIGRAWHLPGLELAAPAVVLATGAKLRRLEVPGEAELTGRGVSQCAFCDGALYRGQQVVVVGGGDAAFQEAIHLAEIGCHVTMLLRGTAPRAQPSYSERAAAFPNLSIRTEVEVVRVLGSDGVDGVCVLDRNAGCEEEIAAAGLFPFIGLQPLTALAPASAERDGFGALAVNEQMLTGASGLYAIGAARSGYGGQLPDARADAVAAAQSIAEK